eukprot:575298-Rhodomonas_salina.1
MAFTAPLRTTPPDAATGAAPSRTDPSVPARGLHYRNSPTGTDRSDQATTRRTEGFGFLSLGSRA